MTIHIAHIVHCNSGTRRAGSLLLLRLHAGFVRIHHAILHRLNSLFARRLRQHTAYIRLSMAGLPSPRSGSAPAQQGRKPCRRRGGDRPHPAARGSLHECVI